MNKKIITYSWLMKIAILLPLFFIALKPQCVFANSVTQTIDTQSDWLSGKYEFNSLDASTSAGFIQLQKDNGYWDASGPANLNHYITGSTKIIKIKQFLYIFRNNSNGQFLRYDMESREWKEMAFTPIEPGGVLDATSNGTDTIWAFATQGGRKHFIQYYIPTNTWSFLTDAPFTLNGDSSLEYVPGTTNYIYAMRGGYTYDFQRYALNGPTAGTWANILNNTGYLDGYGDLIYDGSRYLYMATSWYSPDRFYQYDTWSGGAWVRKGDFPIDNAVQTASDLVRVGNDFYMLRGVGTRTFYKYTYSTNTWAQVADSPIVTSQTALEYDSDNNRIIAYLDYGALLYYYPGTNTWSQPLNGPPANSYGDGTNMALDDSGNAYICRGQGTATCYKYVIATNTWTALNDAPAALNYTSLTYTNGTLYVTTNNGTISNAFYSYNLGTGVWSTLMAAAVGPTPTPMSFMEGSSLVASSSSSIFATRGGLWGYQNFMKFDGSSWTAKTNIPDSSNYRGSGMVKAGAYIYAMNGSNRGRFFRYSETPNTWTELASIPTGTYAGGAMTYDGSDYIYVTTGGENDIVSRQFYRYSISGNKWNRIADAPQMIRNSSGMVYYGGSIYLYQGYGYGMYKYTPPIGTRKYTNYERTSTQTSGIWYSPVYDLQAVDSWNSFSKTDSTPGGTSVTYYSRSSDNTYAWDDWEVTDTTINSIPRRYIQLKAVLVGPADGSATPLVDSISFSYNTDTTGPDMTNFSRNGYSAMGGTALASGQIYTYTHPYFQWSGATDLLSSIDGYYVYFGTNPAAVPSTDGTYQNWANYTVSSGMTYGNTYYLLVQAKDDKGNVSSPSNAFIYTYQGVSPTTVKTLKSQSDWDNNEASKSSVDTSTDAWWNDSYLYRQRLDLNPGVASVSGSIIKVGIDTNALVTAGKLRADRKDWRILYKDNGKWKEINRQYFAPTETYFPLQRNINASVLGNDETNYYVYYGNANENTSPLSDITNSNSSSKWNSGGYFNGANYIQIPTLINNLPQVTIEGWFKFLNSGSDRCIFGETSATEIRTCVYSGNVYMTYNFKTVGGTIVSGYGSTMLEAGKWYHVAETYNASTNTFNTYINGRLDYTSTAITGNVSVTNAQRIGVSNGGSYFYGFLDEIRISNIVRYGSSFSPPTNQFTTDANTLALYHFNETSGQVLIDSSGNNNGGTLGSGTGADSYDPTHTGFYTATALVVENKPVSADASIRLQAMTGGSWAGYQVGTQPLGARMYYGSGTYVNGNIYVLKGTNSKTFYQYDTVNNIWTQLADTPGATYYSSMAYDGGDYLYTIRGNNTSDFYRYKISTDTWEFANLTQPTAIFGQGATIIKGKDSAHTDVYYVLQGNGLGGFLLYYPNTNSWISKTSPPVSAYAGAGMVYNASESSIYLTAGQGYGFYRYSIVDDVWDVSATAPPLAPYPMGYTSNNFLEYNGYLYFFTSYDYSFTNTTKHYIWRYDKTNERWENIDIPTEFPARLGATVYDGSRYVYLLQGDSYNYAGMTAMAKFDLKTNKITPETPPLSVDRTYNNNGESLYHQPNTGSSLAYDGGDNIYYIQGQNSTGSYVNKYQVSTKRWSRLPDIPCSYYGGGMVHTGSTLFAFCGNNTVTGFKYDPANNNWIQLADAPNTINAGGIQIAVYTGGDVIYVSRGANTATLYKYTISTNTWSTESSSGGPTIGNSWGASLTYDGSDNLYLVGGNNGTSFYKYKLSAPIGWTALSALPENIYTGSGSVYNSGKVYVTSGYNNNSLYIYDVATNTWGFGTFAQSAIYGGGAMTKGPGNSIYALQGNGTATFLKFNIPTATTSYVYKGTFTSASLSLGNPYEFAGLSATIASPAATLVTFETRTSTNSADWSSWSEVSNLKKGATTNVYSYIINSVPKKYIQVRATLQSDESVESPVISDIKIEYYDDSTSPTNPTTLQSFKTAAKTPGDELQTNTWHNNESPYFEWNGAIDNAGGSGVAGYYVYFGHIVDADPSLFGTLQTNASYSASLATNGTDDGEYYLKIKTVDKAGNISSDSWTPFHYRYDHTSPNIIGTIGINPRIYTKTNNFALSWLSVTDALSNSTSSGLLGYYYQASSSANIANDNFTTEASVSGILAYQEGENNFSVRVMDIAGNSTAYKNATFYYNVTPPSNPVELGVDLGEAGANKFTFTWQKPSIIKGTVKEYLYVINALPNSSNISTTSATMVSNQKGTRSGSNTFYVVAVDEAGNVDYNNYASVDFDVNITAPSAPLAPETFDNSIRNTKSYRVGITWDKPTDMGSAFDRYEIWGSATDVECSTNMDSYSFAGSTAGTIDGGSYVVTSLGNDKLLSQMYYFCVLACSSNNQCSSPSTTVSNFPTGRWLVAPELIASQSATVKTKSAVVNWSTDRGSNSFVRFGKTSGDYTTEVGSSNQVTYHEITLLGLDPGTTYYYKELWADEDGNMGESGEMSFSTNPAPFISNVKFTRININSADVTFTIKSATKASVQYGQTINYGSVQSISTSTTETTYTIEIPNLIDGTSYHLRIAGEDDEANIYYSDDYTFETLPTPKILNLRLQQVAGLPTATLRLLWSSNTLITSVVSYYPTTNPERAIDSISLALKKDHEVILKNLNDDTDYTLVIKGKDSIGNDSQTITKSVKTSADLRPPEIQNMDVESTIVGVGDTAKAQIVASWDTDEPATTQVEYAQGTGTNYDQTTQEDSNLTTNHTVTITGLTPAKIYHLRASSKDKAGNLGQSFDTVIITPKSTKDALTLVIENLSKTFGFLNSLNIQK